MKRLIERAYNGFQRYISIVQINKIDEQLSRIDSERGSFLDSIKKGPLLTSRDLIIKGYEKLGGRRKFYR